MTESQSFYRAGWILLICMALCGCRSHQKLPPPVVQSPPIDAIDATPLAQPSLPKKVAVNPSLSPWINTEFLGAIQALGSSNSTHGLWVQSASQAYAAYQAQTPLSAASVTKIGTTLAALERLGPRFRFVTEIGYSGSLKNGTLEGDLIVIGGDDPFFVWEDAFAVANQLRQLGIQSISGDLVIQAPFVMNFELDSQASATLLMQGLNSALWSQEAIAQFQTLPAETPQPKIQVQGNIRIVDARPSDITRLVQHQSLPLVELLKRMNRFSNNPMADQIANYLGGAENVTQIVRSLTGLDPQAVQFVNGSGLGTENKITPQGATLMIQALSELLQSESMSLGDVMTIVGQDQGILDLRPLPGGLVVKSGTLDQVSALAGVLPTASEGLIWFSILNTEGDVSGFRKNQELLLQKMVSTWGLDPSHSELNPTLNPAELTTITRPL